MRLIVLSLLFLPFSAFSQLSGIVSSPAEGPMEGVLVSAKKDGSTITITVVSDEKGRYSFPASRLSPGKYALKVRAVGYELEGSSSFTLAEKSSNKTLKLKKTKALADQLS